jgi:hypothetical protein
MQGNRKRESLETQRQDTNMSATWKASNCSEDANERHISPDLGFAQRPQVYAEKPGMGVEPIYSCSAGNRLDRSATPATIISFKLK